MDRMILGEGPMRISRRERRAIEKARADRAAAEEQRKKDAAEEARVEAIVQDYENMSSAELGREAIKLLVKGDEEPFFKGATAFYGKSAALANLAILRAMSESPAVSQELAIDEIVPPQE